MESSVKSRSAGILANAHSSGNGNVLPMAAETRVTSALVVSSTVNVGSVQRRDVDTTFTCLASNSNMTQASREEVTLQMNRKSPQIT